MLRCKVTESGPSFSFISDTSKVTNAINKVVNVTSFSKCSENEKQHLIVAYNSELFVLGYSPETFVVVRVEGVVTDKDASFGFVPKTVLGLIKNRKELSFTYDGSRLTLKAIQGQYSADLTTTEITSSQLPFINAKLKPKKEAEQSLDALTLAKIRTGVNYADITNAYNKDEKPLCHIKLEKKELKIGAFDNHHFVQYTTKVNSTDSFKISMSTEVFKLVDKFIADEKDTDSDFSIRSNSFEVRGTNYTISLPPIQVEDSAFNTIDIYVKGLKAPVGKLKFNSSGIDTVDNMFTLAKTDSRLTMCVYDNNKVSISLKTEEGSISDAFKSSLVELTGMDKFQFMVNPTIFSDLFNKIDKKQDLPIQLYAKLNNGTSSCFIIRNRPDEDSKLLLLGTYYEQ